MAINTSLTPIQSRDFNHAQARHLLSRAGFGGTPQQVQALVDMGMAGAIDHLVDYEAVDDSALPPANADPDIMRPLTAEERAESVAARREGNAFIMEKNRALRMQREAEDARQMDRLGMWWLARMIATPRPLQEKLTLLWHSHFASSHRNVADSYMMHRQNELFRSEACDFSALARGIVRDPAMLKYLNNNQNNRARPNENLGRELMELFTLGEGNYSEQDIKEGARALTGYTINDHDFAFNQRTHDPGEKTILGRTGAFNGDDFVDILLKRADCPRFVAMKLYRHFVADLDEEPMPTHAALVIQHLSELIRKHDYQLKPVLKVLFASRHFHDPGIMGTQIKSPAQLLVGSIRELGAPVRNLAVHADALSIMGQHLYNPPSVAGWAGGQQWINTSTYMTRQNLGVYIITGKLPRDASWTTAEINYDPMFLLEGVPRTADAVVDRLLNTLVLTPVTPDRRHSLTTFLQQRPGAIGPDQVVGLLLLITAMPEYQLC